MIQLLHLQLCPIAFCSKLLKCIGEICHVAPEFNNEKDCITLLQLSGDDPKHTIRTGSSPHFVEAVLDHVGRAQLLPQMRDFSPNFMLLGRLDLRHSSFRPHVVRDCCRKDLLLIENAHKRLERVQIECASHDEILKHYRPTTLFYLDPPHWGRKLYRYNFDTVDFGKFAEPLGRVCGKFVLSLNDVPEVRALFHRFYIKEVELHYTSQKHAGRRYRDVLIANFKR